MGDEIFTIGNPEGLEATLSQGIVSGIRELRGKRYLQITAPISPGSSGGPVLNEYGEVVGVTVGAFNRGQNLNFAIPVSEVADLMAAYKANANDSTGNNTLLPTTKATKEPLDAETKKKIIDAEANVRAQPNSPEAHFALAETLRVLSPGLTERAIDEYRIVIKLRPDDAQAYFGLAQCFHDRAVANVWNTSQLHLETAVSYFKQAIRIDPDFAAAHYEIGQAYLTLLRYDDALAAFRIAIRLAPKIPWYYSSAADAYVELGRDSDAIESYETASSLVPDPSYYHLRIGQLHEKAQHYKEAVASYERVIGGLGNTEGAYEQHLRGSACERLVECYVRTGQLSAGIEYFKQLTTRYPAVGWFHYALGLLNVRSGDKKAALDEYKMLKSLRGTVSSELLEGLFNRYTSNLSVLRHATRLSNKKPARFLSRAFT